MTRWPFVVLLAGLLSAMGGAPEGQDLPPFFDDIHQQPVDATPPPPVLGALDRAVLDLCGAWGDSVREEDFLGLLRRFPHDSEMVLRFSGLESEKKLASLWFGQGGFRHVFCGEPEGATLGGLHWNGRYLQAQRNGWAGLAETCPRQEIAPPVYTVGLRYRRPDGSLGTKCPGGYASSENVLDILSEVSAEVVKVRRPGRVVCLGRGRYPGGTFPLVVVVEDGALVTAYPDVTPPDRPACGEE